MNLFSLIKGKSQEISPWPHILEFSKMKIQSVKADSFLMEENQGIRFVFVIDGKYYWTIENQTFTVFPNDLVVVFPGQTFGSLSGSFEVGTFVSLSLDVDFQDNSELRLGNWSSISDSEQRLISQILSQKDQSIIPSFKLYGELLQKLEHEMFANEIAYKSKVNNLLDEIWIWLARQMSKNENQGRIFPQTFHRLDQMLRENLAHPWTVEEMAAIMGLGTTTFTEKVKAFSGFPPLNYLINLRISEAIRLLKNSDKSLTDIALDTGFYSSQHFSTTFKKLTGYTPGHFRKNK
jgi:AraC-like DNA-binding protein